MKHPLDEDEDITVVVVAMHNITGLATSASSPTKSLADLGQEAFDELLEKLEVVGS